MNKARLIRMRFAGVVCSPSPARRKERATTKRVKQVTITSRPGATDSTVITRMSWTILPAAVPSVPGMSVSSLGTWAEAAVALSKTSNAMRASFFTIPSFNDQCVDDQVPHLAAAADARAVVQILAQVQQTACALDQGHRKR